MPLLSKCVQQCAETSLFWSKEGSLESIYPPNFINFDCREHSGKKCSFITFGTSLVLVCQTHQNKYIFNSFQRIMLRNCSLEQPQEGGQQTLKDRCREVVWRSLQLANPRGHIGEKIGQLQ